MLTFRDTNFADLAVLVSLRHNSILISNLSKD